MLPSWEQLTTGVYPDGIVNEDVINMMMKMIMIWVGCVTVASGLISGITKMFDIFGEMPYGLTSDEERDTGLLAKTFRNIHRTCRIAIHTSVGASVAGLIALTAPISVPIYIILSRCKHKCKCKCNEGKEKENMNDKEKNQ